MGHLHDIIPYSYGLLVCIGYRMILREFLRGSLLALYSPGGRVTSRLDMRDNRKVITDYRNLGIIFILTDLVVSSGYLPGVMRETSSRVVPRKASSCRLGHP